jgi:hypothetical protein
MFSTITVFFHVRREDLLFTGLLTRSNEARLKAMRLSPMVIGQRVIHQLMTPQCSNFEFLQIPGYKHTTFPPHNTD